MKRDKRRNKTQENKVTKLLQQQNEQQDIDQDMDLVQNSSDYDSDIQELLHPKNQNSNLLFKSLQDNNSGRIIGNTKKHFYGADGDQQDQQQDGQAQINDEHAEALRLQKFRASKLKSFANEVRLQNSVNNQQDKAENTSIQNIGSRKSHYKSTKQRLMDIIREDGASDLEQQPSNKHKNSKSKKKAKQCRKLTIKDASQFGIALSQLAKSAQQLNEQVLPLLNLPVQKIGSQPGMSYLDARNSLLLSYMTNLTFYMILKASGKTIQEHPVILRLAYYKTLFQKLRPLDSKLQYQIRKALQMAKESKDSNMVLQEQDFKPRPGQMISDNLKQITDQTDQEQKQSEEIEPSKYHAPMMNATLTDKQLAKERKRLKAGKKNLARTALMQQLHQQMYDIPQQTYERQDFNKKELDQEAKINQYQENQFKRVNLSQDMKLKIKKQKKEAKEQMKMKAGLDGLSFNQITNALNKNRQHQIEIQDVQKRIAQQQAMKESIYKTQVGRTLLKVRKKVSQKGKINEEISDVDLGEPITKKKKKMNKKSEQRIEIDNDIDDELYKNQMQQLKRMKQQKKQKAQDVIKSVSKEIEFRLKTKKRPIYQISIKLIREKQTIGCQKTKV